MSQKTRTLGDCLDELIRWNRFIIGISDGVAILPQAVKENMEGIDAAARPDEKLLIAPAAIVLGVSIDRMNTDTAARNTRVGTIKRGGEPDLPIFFHPPAPTFDAINTPREAVR